MKSAAVPTTPLGTKRLENAFHAVGLFVLVTLTMYFGQVVIVPLALSALFAFILSTPAEWLENKGLGRVGGVLVVTIGAFVLLAAVVTMASDQLRGLATDLPEYEKNVQHKMQPVEALLERIEKVKSNLSDATPPAVKSDAAARPAAVAVQPQQDSLLSWLPSLARPLVEILVNGVLVIVLTVFMLIQRESFRDRLIRLAGRSRLSSTTRALDDAAGRVGKYLLLQLGVNAVLGTLVFVALYFLGVPYAALWGLLVTILRFVPYVGYWAAALGAIGMSAAVSPGWSHPLLVFGMFAALDLTMANVIEPLIFSHGTGVSPVALLVAAVFWAFLWGPVGLLLSTPLTVCLAVLGKHVPALGFLNILLGDEASLDFSGRYYNRLLARDYDEAAVLLDGFAADHPVDETYDEVILPALAQVKTDREQKDVTADEEREVYDATRSLLDGLMAESHKKADADALPSNLPPVRVIGCAVFGQADELALRMLGDAIQPAGGELVIARPEELIEEIGKATSSASKLPIVCLSTLSPGGLSQARAVIAQVRRAHPDLKVLVGRWGQTGDTSQTEKYLRASGANDIGWTLRQTIDQLVPKRLASEEKKDDAQPPRAMASIR